jgi:hypothetical protein
MASCKEIGFLRQEEGAGSLSFYEMSKLDQALILAFNLDLEIRTIFG